MGNGSSDVLHSGCGYITGLQSLSIIIYAQVKCIFRATIIQDDRSAK